MMSVLVTSKTYLSDIERTSFNVSLNTFQNLIQMPLKCQMNRGLAVYGLTQALVELRSNVEVHIVIPNHIKSLIIWLSEAAKTWFLKLHTWKQQKPYNLSQQLTCARKHFLQL